jgi:hypothetical protein
MNANLFKKTLLIAGLTKEEFSKLTRTPIPTINGWLTKRTNKTSNWVKSYLDIYIENNNNKVVIENLKKDIIKNVKS